MKRKALITGVNGMDGSYMAELLLFKGYEIFGTVRHNSSLKNIDHIKDKVYLFKGDIVDHPFIYKSILQSNPDEIYHFASITHNDEAWLNPVHTFKCIAESTLVFLEAILNFNKSIKFLNCSTSEMYGKSIGKIDELTPKCPSSPYGIAKHCAHQNVEMYRNKFGIFACNAICFNHESEKRSIDFVSKKISHNVADIYLKKNLKIKFGDISISKDWSYAPEFIDAMFQMLQYKEPEDFVLSSGKLVDLKSIIEHAFNYANINNWKNFVEYDESLAHNRSAIINSGNSDKAKKLLGWQTNLSIYDIIEKMIDYDVEQIKKNKNICYVLC